MNKEKAINILLEHAIRSTDSSDDAYAPDDSLTAAILFLENDRNKNKKDDIKQPIQKKSSNESDEKTGE